MNDYYAIYGFSSLASITQLQRIHKAWDPYFAFEVHSTRTSVFSVHKYYIVSENLFCVTTTMRIYLYVAADRTQTTPLH